MKNIIKLLLTIILSTSLLHAIDIKAKVVVLTTTDLHGHMFNYNYTKNATNNKVGLNRLASLIKEYKATYGNNAILLDNGDLIQGSEFAEYVVKNIDLSKQVHPIIKAMRYLNYDAINLGNHEFNYGLDILDNTVKNTTVPIINHNIYTTNNNHRFTKYLILNKKIKATDGLEYNVKFAIIGVVPPKIMQWDKANLSGKIIVNDMVEEVKQASKELKKQADVVIALVHSGISLNANNKENVLTQIAEIKDVDYIIGGHTHVAFPNEKSTYYKDLKQIDATKGTINNKPVVIAGFYGSVLGVIESNLVLKNRKWVLDDFTVSLQQTNKEDKEFNKLLAKEQKNTIKYFKKPIAKLSSNLNNYFALVKDDYTIEIVNTAQIEYIKKLQESSLVEYKDLPVLSGHSAFKNGGRMGPDYYIEMKKGKINYSNATDLYVYPNTLHVLKVTGKQLKEYLEWGSQIFNTINPNATTEQVLINYSVPSYLYDVIDGVTYTVDVTQPAKYSGLKVVNTNANRIKNLQYNNVTVKDTDEFLFATNNYRADTNPIINPNGSNLVLDTATENKAILIDYITAQKKLNVSVNNNWQLDIKNTNNVVFFTSPNASKDKYSNFTFVNKTADGFAKFSVNTTQQ